MTGVLSHALYTVCVLESRQGIYGRPITFLILPVFIIQALTDKFYAYSTNESYVEVYVCLVFSLQHILARNLKLLNIQSFLVIRSINQAGVNRISRVSLCI